MAKWSGMIGFATTVETAPGVWGDDVKNRKYCGDLVSNRWRHQNSGEVNDDITVSNEISIIADPYAFENFFAIKYVEFAGQRWKISNVDVQYPRLILTLGGVYNGRSH